MLPAFSLLLLLSYTTTEPDTTTSPHLGIVTFYLPFGISSFWVGGMNLREILYAQMYVPLLYPDYDFCDHSLLSQ